MMYDLSFLSTGRISLEALSDVFSPITTQFFIASTSSWYVTFPSELMSTMARKYFCCAGFTPGMTASRNLPSSAVVSDSLLSASNLSKASFRWICSRLR